jgi:hypothetical protein
MVERFVELVRLARPGRAAILLGGLVTGALLVGVAVADVFEFGAYLSVTSVLTALLVAAAGALLLALRPPGGVAAALVAGFGLLALNELFLLDDRIVPSEAAAGAVAYGLVVLVAMASFVRTLAPLARAGRPWVGAAAVAWGLSVVVVAADPDAGTTLRALEELLQMTGASACIVAAIAALRAAAPPAPAERKAAAIVVEILDELDVPRLAVGIAALIALFGVLGTLVIAGWDSRTFDLNDERTLPAYWSAALLLLAAAFTFALSRSARERGLSPLLLVGLAAFFAILGADEVAAVHERAQHRTGVKGQVFMLPLAAFAGVALLDLIHRLRAPLPRILLIAGAAAWAIAQIVDVVHTPGGGGALDYLIVPEELGEMAGSALLALAMLVAVREPVAPPPAPATRPQVVRDPTFASRH